MGCPKLTYHDNLPTLKVAYSSVLEDSEPCTSFFPFTRKSSAGAYRYGFNGMEKDDEVKDNSNSYDFGARMYDPRLARWLSTDAFEIKYPSVSPYCAMLNTPIIAIDPDGNDVIIFVEESKTLPNGLQVSSGHTAIAVELYEEVEKGVWRKTGKILVGELYPGIEDPGVNTVNGRLEMKEYASIEDYKETFEKEHFNSVKMEYLKLNTTDNSQKTFTTAEIQKDLAVKDYIESAKKKEQSKELKYNVVDFNCTTFAHKGLYETGIETEESIGTQTLEVKGPAMFGSPVIATKQLKTPNEFYNDLLKSENLEKKSTSKNFKMDEKGAQKYVDAASKQYKNGN
jgi:RHS repeat-associated protein